MEISESTWAFIAKHRREDVRDVALHAKHDGDVDVPFALEQIAGWAQRASLKLPDWASHDGLIFPPQVPMEQCSSQFTAQYKARLAQRLLAEEAVDDDSPASLVDLTGGFGVDFSYMSRVFNRATYVEQQSILCDIARHNFPILGLDHAEVINDDSTAVLDTLGRVSTDLPRSAPPAVNESWLAYLRDCLLHAGCADPEGYAAGQGTDGHGQALPHARRA